MINKTKGDDLTSTTVVQPTKVEELTIECESLKMSHDRLLDRVDDLTRERDELRKELEKSRMSRQDEFVKAAITGILSQPHNIFDSIVRSHEYVATTAINVARFTIKALDILEKGVKKQ